MQTIQSIKVVPLLFLWGCTAFVFEACYPLESQAPSRVYYQIFLRSFADSDGDGIGDLPGLIQQLPYLDSLGVQGIWLLPIHPSPSYHKYDVTDYYKIDSVYGTMADFDQLVKELHYRDMHLLIDFVVNHTDDEHPWFQSALTDTISLFHSFYVWDDTSLAHENPYHWHAQPADGEQSNETGKVFNGFFWKGMPDLNYDQVAVRDSVKAMAQFWLVQHGIDGLRLDAALHIYPYYHSQQSEHLKKTLQWWQEFRAFTDSIAPSSWLVGEVWEGDSTLLSFYDAGLHACFHFDLSKWIIQDILAEKDTSHLVANLQGFYQEQMKFGLESDAIFLTNHDQDRVRSVLGGDLLKTKLAASILLTLPGNPFIYYGEELGMLGQKPDEHIREPFPWGAWSPEAQTNWLPLRHNLRDSTKALDQHLQDEYSLFRHYQELISLRSQHELLHSGQIEASQEEWPESVLAYYRVLGGDRSLVMHNLSGERVSWTNLQSGKPWCSLTADYQEGSIGPYQTLIYGLDLQ
ncbi:MAG: alpha-amylase family glycosyl hydrolase [Bacteroidota bacterium]